LTELTCLRVGPIPGPARLLLRRKKAFLRIGTSSTPSGLSFHIGGRTMLLERGPQITSVEVVGDAYAIAANYLRRTGVMPDTVAPNDKLADIIVQLFQHGETNKLRLANKAISIFELANAA
jgi:hypothetical protein